MKYQEFYCYPYDDLTDEKKINFILQWKGDNWKCKGYIQPQVWTYTTQDLLLLFPWIAKKSPDWKKKANLAKEFCNASNESKTKETLNFLKESTTFHDHVT